AAATMASVYDAPAALRFSLAAVMSTSREMENCGCSRMLFVMRSAMARRMRERGSLFSFEEAGGDALEGAASTSSSVTRPPGPLPLILEMSTPSSCARLRAAGDERTRSPSDGPIGGSASEGPRPPREPGPVAGWAAAGRGGFGG